MNDEAGERLVKKKLVRQAVALWQLITLAGVGILSLFIIWHLRRRAAMVRSRIQPPKMKPIDLELPSTESPQSDSSTTST